MCDSGEILKLEEVYPHFKQEHPEIDGQTLKTWASVQDGRTFSNTKRYGSRFIVAHAVASDAADEGEEHDDEMSSVEERQDEDAQYVHVPLDEYDEDFCITAGAIKNICYGAITSM